MITITFFKFIKYVNLMKNNELNYFTKNISPEEIQISNDLNVLNNGLTQVNDVAEGLEEIKEAMLVALGNGGMTAGEAAFARLAVKNACGRWVKPLAIPSTENFEEDQYQATLEAIDDTTTTLEKIWLFIKRMLVKLWYAIKSAFTKYIFGAGKLASSANTLMEQTFRIKGTPPTKLLINKYYISLLKVNTEYSITTIINGLKDLSGELQKWSNSDTAVFMVTKYCRCLSEYDFSTAYALETSYNKLTDDIKNEFKLSTYVEDFKSKSTLDFDTDLETKIDNSIVLTEKMLLIGNKKLIAKFIGDKETNNLLTSFELKFTSVANTGSRESTSGSIEIITWTSNDCENVLKWVITISNIIYARRKMALERDKLFNEFNEIVDRKVKDFDRLDNQAKNSPAGKYFSSLIKSSATIKAIIEPDNDFLWHCFNVSRAAYSIAKDCLNSYERKN